MPVIDTPQALARQLSDDVGLGSGRLTAATIRAVVAALVVLDDELLGLCLGADVWPDDRGPAQTYTRRVEGGSGQEEAVLAALATPTGRRLTAAALGLTSYAHLRAAPPGAAPVGDVEGALTRKPPRRPVRSEGDEPSGTASWHLSEEAASFVDQSVQPVLWRQVTPSGVRASALRFVDGRHRAGWRAWAACLRFGFAAWEADRTSLVRLLVREATSWNEAARIVDNLLSDAITGPFAIHDIKPADPVSVGAAVASCAGNPDNVVLPAPDPRVVDEAQARLGIEFPPHLLAFLRHSNGISIAGGRFQLFGVGPDAAVDLTSFNSPQGWQSRLPSGWLTDRQVLWVGAQYDHELVGFDVRHHENPGMRRFEDRAEATLRVKGSCLLTRSLGNNCTNMLTGNSNVRIADHPDVTWRSVLAQTGPVPPGTGFILGPDHHLDGIDDARGARVLPLEDALIATSWLAHRASTETRSEFAGPIVDPMEPEASHWIVADRQGP